MNKSDVQISKFLSLVLRHRPEKIGIKLDQNGWVDVDTLLAKANSCGMKLDRSAPARIVETNSKKRFAFNDSFDKIRASQGHSVDIKRKIQTLFMPLPMFGFFPVICF